MRNPNAAQEMRDLPLGLRNRLIGESKNVLDLRYLLFERECDRIAMSGGPTVTEGDEND